MNAERVEDLIVYQKAMSGTAAISAIIQRPTFRDDPRLRDQLGASSERCASTISEGFEQSTDRFFAQYCYRSRGSAREIRTQMVVAVQRFHMTEAERIPLDRLYEEIGKMLTALIAHLERENRKQRRSPARRGRKLKESVGNDS